MFTPKLLLLFFLLEYSVEMKSDQYSLLCSQKESVVSVASEESQVNQCKADDMAIKCSSLQAALTYVRNSSNNLTICIEESSLQFVQERMLFDQKSIQIVSKESVTVECAYNSNLADDIANGNDYTWFFNGSSLLLLVNVHLMFCPYPLRIVGVKNVLLQNSTFKNFSEAVLDIFNCESVSLNSVRFQDNVGTGTFQESFRGNTGALSMSFQNYPMAFSEPRVTLANCQFINNRAEATENFLSPNEALSRDIYTGRGGSIGIFINEDMKDVTINIEDSAIVNSYARSLGGGVFMIISGRLPRQHLVKIIRTNISLSFAQVAGSGVFVGYLSATDTVETPHSVLFEHCNFVNNTGFFGGGVYIVTSFVGSRGNYFKFDGCTFFGNRGVGSPDEIGAAISVALYTIFEQRVSAVQHDIVNCTFMFNSGGNGIVNIGYAPVKFSGRNAFIGNDGAALRIIGSLVDFEGDISFINNTAFEEGALSLLSYGQMRVHRGVSLNFFGNRGRIGSSIVVSSPQNLLGFTKLIGNPQCFILYENSSIVPPDWEITINVDGNSALLGSALYLPHLGRCSWTTHSPPYFNDFAVLDWPAWNFGQNTNTGYRDQHNRDYYIGTNAQSILVRTTVAEVSPGRQFPMSIVGIDEFEHFTSTNTRFFQSNVSTENDLLRFVPGIVVIPGTELLTDEFLMKYYFYEKSSLPKPPTTIEIEEPFETSPILSNNFTIVPQLCPAGYSLTKLSELAGSDPESVMSCECFERAEVIACEEEDDVLVRDGYWVGYVPTKTPNLIFHPCPPQYCQCSLNSSVGPERCVYTFTESAPDRQCNSHRKGLLCGVCKNNTGVTVLLNNCVICSNGFLSLIAALVVLDITMFVIIMLIDKPVIGWLYPFIFYIQVAPLVSQYFPESFQRVGVYLTYIRSALSFYFVYDFCLYENLPPLASYALRFIPLLTALISCSFVLIIRKTLHKKSIEYHGLWFIFLLLYPHLVETSLAILNCPMLMDSAGSIQLKWLVDTSVQCFSEWHIPLSLLSIVIIFFCGIAVIFLFLFSCKEWKFAQYVMVPIMEPLNNNAVWWASIEVGRRLVLQLLLITFPLNTVYLILLLVSILATVCFCFPYERLLSNFIEIILLMNVIILLLVDATPIIRELLFVFPERNSVSPINWLLGAIYYFPIFLLFVVSTGDVVYTCLRKEKQPEANDKRDVNFPSDNGDRQIPPTVTTLVVSLNDN